MNDGYDARMYYDKDEVLNLIRHKMSNDVIHSAIPSLKNNNMVPELGPQLSQALNAYVASRFSSDQDLETSMLNNRDQLIPNIELLLENMQSLPQEALKIACFSETKVSPSMWGLYSENETGFCLEYSFESNQSRAQSNDGKTRLCDLFPVIYKAEKYQVASSFIEYLVLFRCYNDALQSMPNMFRTFITQYMKKDSLVCPDLLMGTKIALYKSQEWESEKEWRLFCNAINDSSFQIANNGHFIKKPTAIFLGRRISETHEKILSNLAIEKGIPVYKMQLNDSSMSFDLTFDELHAGGCDCQ